MNRYGSAKKSPRDERFNTPSETLRVGVTFRRKDGGTGPTKFGARLSSATVSSFRPDPVHVQQAIHELSRRGFTFTGRGPMTASMRVKRADFEKVFGTKLSRVDLDPKMDYSAYNFYYPPKGAPWNPQPEVANLVDDVYIQWPHLYFGGVAPAAALPTPSLTPPTVDYFHLEMPHGVPDLLNVSPVHRAGITGQGVRVCMVDSGFAHKSHPFFAANNFNSTVDLAPHAANDQTDLNGHGTGESTNLFSVAPGVTFIGVKVDNDNDPQNGASMLEGFQTALQHQPQVISISMGYDLRDPITQTQLDTLPGNLAALEAEIQAAVAAGIVVVFSAGNGHISFPGMMPEILSAGGVFVDATGQMRASDYASAFNSKIFSGRHVPDFCGLVGMLPHASYIMLPIPAGCEIDAETSQPADGNGDETTVNDGWGVFSGTSAAAPQLAGVCALLLQKNPSLQPNDIRAILRRTARTVSVGAANPASSDDGVGMPASSADDGAAGAGLIDAFAAFQQA